MQRLLLTIKLFALTVAICLTQKPMFMLWHSAAHTEVGVGDYADVLLHSLSLDCTVAGYITALPWLLILISFFVKTAGGSHGVPEKTDGSRHDQRKTDWLRCILIPYYIIISLLLSLVFVADAVLYGFWGFKIDATVFAYTDKPADAVASVSGWYVTTVVAVVVAFAAVYAWAFITIIRSSRSSQSSLSTLSTLRSRNPMSSMIFKFAVHIIVGGLLFLAIRGGVGEGTANVSRAYYSSNQFLNHSAVNPLFNMLYSLTHQQNFAKEFRFMDEAERQAIADEIWPAKYQEFSENSESSENSEYSEISEISEYSEISENSEFSEISGNSENSNLSTSRPNILLVVWEGCGARMVESLGGYKGVTPNLERIISGGILFTNCHATSFRTDRGLVSILSGWPGMPSASLMKIPGKCNNLPGIARSLAENGYTTDFWYGGDITFTNMGGFMLANGFQKTHSDADFAVKDRSYSKWGVVDGILLDRLADTLLARPTNGRQPWFTTVLTLSSHEPWEVPYSRLADKKQNAFAYTDECIGKFINRLKDSELWKDLLVVITADHGVAADDADTRSSLPVVRIPLVLTGGALGNFDIVDNIDYLDILDNVGNVENIENLENVENVENLRKKRAITKITSQADIAATLLGLLGLDHSHFPFSRNVLSPAYRYPSALHTSPIDATFTDSTGTTTYDFAGRQVTFSTDENCDGERTKKIKAALQTIYDKAAEL